MFGKLEWTIFTVDERTGEQWDGWSQEWCNVTVEETFAVYVHHSSKHHYFCVNFIVVSPINSGKNPKIKGVDVIFDHPFKNLLGDLKARFKHWLWEKREWWREKRGYYDKIPF